MSPLSSSFLLFLPIAWLVFHLLPSRLRPWALLTASLLFYASHGWLPLLILCSVTVLVWLGDGLIRRRNSGSNRLLMRLFAVVLPLLVLAFFKYSRLFAEGLNSLGGWSIPLPNWAAPIGISFFLFKLMSFGIDQLRSDAPQAHSFPQLLLFAGFFPQVLSGPIDRSRNLIPQLWRGRGALSEDLALGITRIVWGLFKKVVVADRLALFVNPVFNNPQEYHGLNVLMAVYFYAVQIYCDFSGYSDMAIGLGRLFGIRSLENFARPYSSASMSEFWNRWHITLSTWLRDYLFLPVSYAILPRGRETPLRNVHSAYVGGIIVTMILGGLWHAASWTMISWGALHGIYLAAGHMSRKWRRRLWKRGILHRISRLRPVLARLFTFHLVALAWVFFKAPDFNSALAVLGGISLGLSGSGLYHLLFTALFLLAFLLLAPVFDDEKAATTFAQKKAVHIIFWLGLLFVLTVIFSVDQHNEFIYFSF